ncbi:MAG: hypothetical protein ACLFRD_02405 [Nitriliruptoraceae bacterium]
MTRQEHRRWSWHDPIRGVLGVALIGLGVIVVGTALAALLVVLVP